ncbi:hypothetical protein Hanom_Chr08g00733831 [Helianthus anomalus]
MQIQLDITNNIFDLCLEDERFLSTLRSAPAMLQVEHRCYRSEPSRYHQNQHRQ